METKAETQPRKDTSTTERHKDMLHINRHTNHMTVLTLEDESHETFNNKLRKVKRHTETLDYCRDKVSPERH